MTKIKFSKYNIASKFLISLWPTMFIKTLKLKYLKLKPLQFQFRKFRINTTFKVLFRFAKIFTFFNFIQKRNVFSFVTLLTIFSFKKLSKLLKHFCFTKFTKLFIFLQEIFILKQKLALLVFLKFHLTKKIWLFLLHSLFYTNLYFKLAKQGLHLNKFSIIRLVYIPGHPRNKISQSKRLFRKINRNVTIESPKMHYEPKFKQRDRGDFDYKNQLNEKKKLSKFYGHLSEKQLKRWYRQHLKKNNYSNSNSFLIQLELRLDTIIYRLHITNSIFAAKQFVLHNKVLLNNKITNIPSVRLKVSDYLTLKSNLKLVYLQRLTKLIIQKQLTINRFLPYFEINYQTVKIKLIDLPKISEIFYSFPLNHNRTKYRYSL